jgi:hypothetical protein
MFRRWRSLLWRRFSLKVCDLFNHGPVTLLERHFDRTIQPAFLAGIDRFVGQFDFHSAAVDNDLAVPC